MTKRFENSFYIGLLALIGLLSIWLQAELIEEEVTTNYQGRHDPDYYIENFTAKGMNKQGSKNFMLEAERLAHFPDDDTALLDKPHLVQYFDGLTPRHIYADSGWLSSGGDEVLMTGNVKVTQAADSRGGGFTQKTKKMRVLLDKSVKKHLKK